MTTPTHDQHDAVGAVGHEAEIELALHRGGQRQRAGISGPTVSEHRGGHDEGQTDGEQHLVELGRAVKPRNRAAARTPR